MTPNRHHLELAVEQWGLSKLAKETIVKPRRQHGGERRSFTAQLRRAR
jgi:hypothetical protein